MDIGFPSLSRQGIFSEPLFDYLTLRLTTPSNKIKVVAGLGFRPVVLLS
jgi:hypothetical protein